MTNPLLVVLGAGPGIGTSVARRFGRDGFDVALVGRREAELARIGGALQSEGITAGWAPADVADSAVLTEALERFAGHAGRVDVLHHNISTFRAATASQTTAAELLADVAVGVASLLTAVRAVLPWMLEAGTGTVLATGSGAADRPMTDGATLGVQKAALRNLVQAMAAELRPRGVHVATVTVHGVLAEGTAFTPDAVAEQLFDLAAETAGPVEAWRRVVDFRG
ncbi:MAG: SDR family NAD(P)-dependent oxidoreductase [Actinomycetes bacterium]